MKQVAIIGYGRFGRLLADIFKPGFNVRIVQAGGHRFQAAKQQGYEVVPLRSISEADYIYLAVPISSVETVIKEIAPLVGPRNVVIDTCSVKVYPAGLMKKHLSHCQTIASHPLFGPDSASKGLSGLKLVLCPLSADVGHIRFWRRFWENLGVEVTVTTPEAHDQDSVYSQALTYSIARIVAEMNIPELAFTTRSYRNLKQVSDLSAKDSEQLFHDMLYYNPYFPRMKAELQAAVARVLNRLGDIEQEAGEGLPESDRVVYPHEIPR